jgi:hypothetical protein
MGLLCTYIVPRSQGGDEGDDNLITRCRRCAYLAQKERGTPTSADDCPF